MVCSAGPARVQQVIREALARGADRAIHVEDDALGPADAFGDRRRAGGRDARRGVRPGADRPAVRRPGARADRRRAGRAPRHPALDHHHGRAGRTTARLRVKRELEGGWFQWVAMPLPALLTIQSGINQLRYATLKGIMAAKKKEIRKVAPAARLGRALADRGALVPQKQSRPQMIDGLARPRRRQELVRRLRDEARRGPGDSRRRRAARTAAQPRHLGSRCRRAAAGRRATPITVVVPGADVGAAGRGARGRGVAEVRAR